MEIIGGIKILLAITANNNSTWGADQKIFGRRNCAPHFQIASGVSGYK